MSGEVLSVRKHPNAVAVFAVVGVEARGLLTGGEEVIHFHEGDAGAAIVARYNRGVCAGR